MKGNAMRIEGIRTLEGPNVFHNRPVIVMSLRLLDLADTASTDIPGFTDRLVNVLPGLHTHHCSRGREGGFVERLREGTYFGHIVEHIALELAGSVGSSVTYGKTRYAGEPGFYDVIVRFDNEAGMRFLLRTAVELAQALVRNEAYQLEDRLEQARQIISETALGPSTSAIVRAASRRGIPWRRLNDASLIEFGYGRHRKLVQAALSGTTSHLGVEAAEVGAHADHDGASSGRAVIATTCSEHQGHTGQQDHSAQGGCLVAGMVDHAAAGKRRDKN